jgi:two-component system phosphate regulon response regulator OmpR
LKSLLDIPDDAEILFVDDDEVVRKVYQQVLTRGGYQVHTAEDANTGYQLLQRVPLPLLITDIVMEGMDGLELIARLRRQGVDTRIIAITWGGASDARECLHISYEMGADWILTKPIAPVELIKAVTKLLPKNRRKGLFMSYGGYSF